MTGSLRGKPRESSTTALLVLSSRLHAHYGFAILRTTALNLNCFPPLTTLVTRRTWITLSWKPSLFSNLSPSRLAATTVAIPRRSAVIICCTLFFCKLADDTFAIIPLPEMAWTDDKRGAATGAPRHCVLQVAVDIIFPLCHLYFIV